MPDESPEKQMKAPLFAELFYATVIAFALRSVEFGQPHYYYIGVLFIYGTVLEDWYNYHNYVKPHIVNAQRYSPYALAMEFLILFCWSLAFAGFVNNDIGYTAWLGGFFAFRWFTGIRYHYIRRNLISWNSLIEQSYGVLALLCFGVYWTSLSRSLDFALNTGLIALLWVLCIVPSGLYRRAKGG